MKIWKRKSGGAKSNNKNDSQNKLSAKIKDNLAAVIKITGNAADLNIREFTIDSTLQTKAAILNLYGLIDKKVIDESILNPLMKDFSFRHCQDSFDLFSLIKENVISNNIIREIVTIDQIVKEVIIGNTVFLLNGINKGLVIGTQGYKDRSVSEPVTEGVVRGPRDGFIENIQTNITLIRRRIKAPDLRIDEFVIGTKTQTDVAIIYLNNVVKPQVVDEVKKRLQRITIDGILESGYIEELIEDNPYSPFPQIEHSERPDKVAGAILEGRVAIMVDTTPFVLIVPTVFFQFIQSAEDYYERYLFSSLVRGVRILALSISVILPALYIAVTSFHQEMIPTPLALSIAASREGVPFPAIGEALIMEATFEILREAGIRLPRPTGQAVSIVGALVIGQAAVQAGIVSQAMVIIVALTGISSFAVPAFNAAFAGRLLRFPLMFLAAFLGLPGIMAGLSIILIHMCSLRSFGVNYLSSVTAPKTKEFKDLVVRKPWWAMKGRPASITGKAKQRMEKTAKPNPQAGKSNKNNN